MTMPRHPDEPSWALTGGQADRLRFWLLGQAEYAEAEAARLAGTAEAPTLIADSHRGFLRGQADAFRAAERSLRVASVGAL